MTERNYPPNHLHRGADRLARRIGVPREVVYQLRQAGWPIWKLIESRTSPLVAYERDIAAKIEERMAAGREGL